MFSWFRKTSSEENYEQALASLELSIRKRETRLSEIRLRERRATLLITLWTFSVWGGYVALWWTGFLGQRGRGGRNVLWGLPVFMGPIAIVFTRRLVQLWYSRKGNAEEKTLKELMVSQRKKIEEIKEKTKFYSTKSLLERYDSKQTSAPSTPQVQKRIPNPSPQPRASLQPRVITNGAPAGQIPLSQENIPIMPYSPAIGQLPTPNKQWYDKLADAILGDDTASTGPSAASRYALICGKCFTHNGLVKEEHWEDAQYMCFKCGHFNNSIRARKISQASGSPQTAKPTSTVPALASAATSVHTPTSPVAQPVVDLPTQDTVVAEPPSPSQPVTPATAVKRKFEKSPLSESTVLVEKSDAEHMDVDS